MSGLEMEAKDLEFAIDMASDSKSVDRFWELFSDKANSSWMLELESVRKTYIEHLAEHHFGVEELNEVEEKYHGDKHKKALVFLFAGLYSLNKNAVPSLHSDIMDTVRRGYESTRSIETHREYLRSLGDINRIFITETMERVAIEDICPTVEGSGFIYGLGVAWIMAMKKDDPSLKIPEMKEQLERINRMPTLVTNAPELEESLRKDLEVVLEGVNVSTEPGSI